MNNTEKENSGVASQDVAPVAPGAGNSAPEKKKNVVPASVGALTDVEAILDALGVAPGALDTLEAQTGVLESILQPFVSIGAVERTRFRLQARGNIARTDKVKDLTAQFAGSVPAETAATLAGLDAVRDRIRAEAERMRNALLQVEDAETLVSREFQRRTQAARAALQVESRFSAVGLRQQVRKTTRRRVVKPVAATGSGNGSTAPSTTVTGAGNPAAAAHSTGSAGQ